MLFHAAPEKVLVIGGGGGGILREVFRHPVASTDYTEQDPLIINFFKQFSTPLTEYELQHETIVIHPQEGRLFLMQTDNQYDLIMVNFPVPSTLLLNRYYTVEFFRLAREHLAEDGLFAISLPGSETFLGRELRDLNQTVYSSLREVFPRVRILVGNENIFLGTVQLDLESIGPELLIDRLATRKIGGGLITDQYLRYKFDRQRFGPLATDIQKVDQQRINTDQQPAAVIKSMIFLNMISAPIFAGYLAAAADIPFAACLVIVCIAVLTMIACQYRSKKQPYIMTAVFTTGFTGMFMHITLILAFQIYYGYVYHYIGLLIALFMLGLAAGAYLATRVRKPVLAPVEAAIVIHTVLVYGFFFAEPAGMLVSSLGIYVFSFISGVLTGAEYPLAVSRASRPDQNVSIMAGKLYGVDLIGGFWGAILTAVFLLPVMGIKNGLLLVILLKGGSLAMAWISER
jgi:spermidine synthase